VKLRKHFSWLLVVLLVAALTGQAATAFTMPCRGTASCCCATPATDMNMTGPTPAGMERETRHGCCETKPSQPCDIERGAQPAALPFLTTAYIDRADLHPLAGIPAIIVEAADVPHQTAFDHLDRPDRGHPPLYIAIQTFLC
jgi:hypothetical protein